MTDAVEVAIESALLARAQAFAAAQSPVLTIALPNVTFTPPAVSPTAKYLRATFLPADSFELGITYSATNQHYGLFQLDVFYGTGGGEIAPARIAALIIAYFTRGTVMSSSGFKATVFKTPYRGAQVTDGAWTFIPVRIPYQTFAPPA